MVAVTPSSNECRGDQPKSRYDFIVVHILAIDFSDGFLAFHQCQDALESPGLPGKIEDGFQDSANRPRRIGSRIIDLPANFRGILRERFADAQVKINHIPTKIKSLICWPLPRGINVPCPGQNPIESGKSAEKLSWPGPKILQNLVTTTGSC